MKLYFGNRCRVEVASLQSDQSWSGWTELTSQHGSTPDTRDIAFRSDGSAYLLSSDGGIETSSDGLHFHFVGGPAFGLDADQVTEVTGQYVLPNTSQPDLYFGTWHNNLWSMRGTSGTYYSPAMCCEGGVFGMDSVTQPPSLPPAQDRIIFTHCGPCANSISNIHLTDSSGHTGGTGWHDAQSGVSMPTRIARNQYVQAVNSLNPLTGQVGLWSTNNEGRAGSWHPIGNVDVCDLCMYGLPKVSSIGSHFTLTQAINVGPIPAGECPAGADYCGLDQIQLAQFTGFSTVSPGTVRYLSMTNFGSLGVLRANTFSYEVLGVDPNDPSHIIAPDIFRQDVRVSRYVSPGGTLPGGYDSWSPIAGLTDLVTHHNAYLFSNNDPGQPRRDPLVSTVSFCSYNSSRVLIGTHQGGAYFSFDGGQSWTRVTGSEPITDATSVFWLAGCGSAFMSSFGRGIWQINMDVHTQVIGPNEPCEPSVCRLENLVRRYIHVPHPWPSPINGVVISDGFILSKHTNGKSTTVTVTDGSIVTPWVKMPANVKVVVKAGLPPQSKRYARAVFFHKGKLLGTMYGDSPLRLFPGAKPHVFTTPTTPIKPPRGNIDLDAQSFINGTGTALLPPRQPLVVHASVFELSKAALYLSVDGQIVAKAGPEAKGIDYEDKSTQFGQGYHSVRLFTWGGKEPDYIASAGFAVPNGDDDTGK
jgi:hypothetical protein